MIYVRDIASWVDDLTLGYVRGEKDDERMRAAECELKRLKWRWRTRCDDLLAPSNLLPSVGAEIDDENFGSRYACVRGKPGHKGIETMTGGRSITGDRSSKGRGRYKRACY